MYESMNHEVRQKHIEKSKGKLLDMSAMAKEVWDLFTKPTSPGKAQIIEIGQGYF